MGQSVLMLTHNHITHSVPSKDKRLAPQASSSAEMPWAVALETEPLGSQIMPPGYAAAICLSRVAKLT